MMSIEPYSRTTTSALGKWAHAISHACMQATAADANRCPAICLRCNSSPVEVTLLVDFGKVYTQAQLIARHGDFKHPGGRVQPLGGPLDPGDCLIVGNQVT